jgi:hypothetical protein
MGHPVIETTIARRSRRKSESDSVPREPAGRLPEEGR